MAGTSINGNTPTSKLEPLLPEDAIPTGQKQGKAVTPVNPEKQIPSSSTPEHTQTNQRDVKSVEQGSADNNPIQKQSSPEAISKIQEILKEDGTLAQSYNKLVKRNSVQRSSDILEALLHENSLWKKKPDKALTSFIKKSNSLINNVSNLKIAIDIAPYGKVQLIPAGDQLKKLALSTDQLRELVEVSLQLAKGMLSLVELDQLDNQNSRQNIETLEQEVQANISELSEEHQQQVREKLKSVKNPTLHISIRGIDLWPDIQSNLHTHKQDDQPTQSSHNEQPEPSPRETPRETPREIKAKLNKYSKGHLSYGFSSEQVEANVKRKNLMNNEFAKNLQKKRAELNEKSESPIASETPKVPLKTPETEKAPPPAKSPTAPAPAPTVTANSKQPVINQQKTEATQQLDLNEQQIQFFENEQLIQERRTLKLKALYYTDPLSSDNEELTDRTVHNDDVDFFRAFYAYYIMDEDLLNNEHGATYFSTMLNTVDLEVGNTPEKIKTAITKGIEQFNKLLKEEALADSTLDKKVIQALNEHSNETLPEAIFTHCFTTPVFNHRNYNGLIKALGLSKPLNPHDLFDLKSLTDCIASQLMEDFEIPLSDGKSEGILIKDNQYMLRVAGDYFDVDEDEE